MSNSQPSFIPPFFYNFAQQFKALNVETSIPPLAINFVGKALDQELSSGITLSEAGPVGSLKQVMPTDKGVLTLAVSTDNNASVSVANKTLVPTMDIVASAAFKNEPMQRAEGELYGAQVGIGAAHARENVAFTAGVRSAFKPASQTSDAKSTIVAPVLDGSMAVGFGGFSVGAESTIDSATLNLLKADFGAEYTQGPLTTSVLSSKLLSALTTSTVYRHSSVALLGASATVDFSPRTQLQRQARLPTEFDERAALVSTKVALMGQFRPEPSSLISFRATSLGELRAGLLHMFPANNASVSLSCSTNVDKELRWAPATWGVAVTVGDL